MSTMIWLHTRKKTPMVKTGNHSTLLLHAMMIRQVYPGHPIYIDGKLI